MNKNRLNAVLLWAEWDSRCIEKKINFIEECKRLGIWGETLSVEDKEGLSLSIKHQIRNVPAIIVYRGHKLIGIEKGNDGYKNLIKYT